MASTNLRTNVELTGLKICALDFGVVKALDVRGVMYYAKQTLLVSLHKIFKEQAEAFFNMFGGVNIYLPELSDERRLSNSHVPEVGAYFGRQAVEDLYDRFGARATIRVPSAETVRGILTDLVLYSNVRTAKEEKRRVLSRKLSEQYGVPHSKITLAYKKISEDM